MSVVSTLNATRKRTGKIRSNLHTCQYADSVSHDHSQGQTLVEPLAFPGVAKRINKFLCNEDHSKKGQWTCHIYTSGLNYHWLKVVTALEVMIFFTSLCCSTSLLNCIFYGEVMLHQYVSNQQSMRVSSVQ